MPGVNGVPVIDVAPFGDGSPEEKGAVAQVVDRACTEIGFFAITGHGVPDALVERLLRLSYAFFDLPLEEKFRVGQPRPEQSRGYIGMGAENLSYSRGDRTTTDLKELFMIGPVDAPADDYHTRPEAYPSFAPNLWPARPEGFRETWSEYYRVMQGLAWRLMRIFAIALDLPEEHFWPCIDKPISPLRANHYPEQLTPPAPGQLRAGGHTDYGVVTILKPENVPGGLQVLNRHGEWVDVEAPSDAFVCNIGDLMARWTNDRWVSTLHRVVNPPRELAMTNRRLSIPFFFQPNYDAPIECLPTCRSALNPPKYEPVIASQHRMEKFLRSLGAKEPIG